MSVMLRKVLISDPVDEECVRLLQEHGIEATCKYRLSKDDLLKEVKNYEGLIVRSETKVTADVIAATTSLKVIGRAGTGVDNIDIDAATRKGIIVLNAPGGNSISACELTCALISNLARNVTEACTSLKDGRWDRKLFMGFELSGKTLAVLGLGRIGREVAARMQSYGMRVIGFDPLVSASDAKAFNVEKMELEEIWPLADFITVHTPLIAQTRNLINEAVLSKCKKGVRVVNVARGGIVDESALLAALKSGWCGGAGLDVFVEEPPKNDVTWELIRHPKVVATPHLGASTAEAQRRVAVEVAEQFVALASNCRPEDRAKYQVTGAVNAPILSAVASPANEMWLTLAKELGKIISKMAQGVVPDTLIEIKTSGTLLGNMKFLATAVLMGMLTGHTKNGLNMINAPILAKEAGIQVVTKHNTEDSSSSLLHINVFHGTVSAHSIQGTVKADGLPYLLAINGATFEQGGVLLGNNSHLFQGQDRASGLAAIIAGLSAKGATITSLAVASGKSAWFVVRTADTTSIPTIPGVVVF